MAAEVGHQVSVIVPVVVGLIIGVIEAYFVYEDENMTSGQQFLGDMWHGMIFCILGVLAAANVPYLVSHQMMPNFLLPFLYVDAATGISLTLCVIITLIMLIKMVSSHAIRGVSGMGFKEKFWHKLVVACLVGFSPYYIGMFMPMLSPLQAVLPFLPL